MPTPITFTRDEAVMVISTLARDTETARLSGELTQAKRYGDLHNKLASAVQQNAVEVYQIGLSESEAALVLGKFYLEHHHTELDRQRMEQRQERECADWRKRHAGDFDT